MVWKRKNQRNNEGEKIESENQSAKKVKVEKNTDQDQKKWLTTKNIIRHHVNRGQGLLVKSLGDIEGDTASCIVIY